MVPISDKVLSSLSELVNKYGSLPTEKLTELRFFAAKQAGLLNDVMHNPEASLDRIGEVSSEVAASVALKASNLVVESADELDAAQRDVLTTAVGTVLDILIYAMRAS